MTLRRTRSWSSGWVRVSPWTRGIVTCRRNRDDMEQARIRYADVPTKAEIRTFRVPAQSHRERTSPNARARAILADEVGLGKTIEAALILSELRLRGMANRSLIIVPAGLVEQWQEELDRKFALPSIVLGKEGLLPDETNEWPVVLTSLPRARRPQLRDLLASIRWDLVIVDEAHRVKQPRSASARLVHSLATRSLLLLTATPVENRLDDIFQLVSLVKPGHLGSIKEFRARHGGARTLGARTSNDGLARDLIGLPKELRKVMVRHRRSEVALMLPRRLAETLRVPSSQGRGGAVRGCLGARTYRGT